MTEPSNGEVMRRLEQVSGELVQLARDMREDRNAAADTYVRKDVQRGVDANQDRRLDGLEAENATRERDQVALRRQLIVGLVLLAVPALFSLVLAMNSFLSRGVTP